MENLRYDNEGSLYVMSGAMITGTIREAIALSGEESEPITLEFNGVMVTVRADSNPDTIYRDWQRAQSGCIKKNVGPYPKPELTEEEKANDARIEAKNEQRRQKAQAECEAKVTAKQNAVRAKLTNAPAIELANEAAWQQFSEKNPDDYGGAVIIYAERWARLMQLELANGKALEEVASATSDEADTEGITGFMYGCAVSALAQCWKHGEQLRTWHNLSTQLGDEGEKANESGGVLNPALLSFGA